MPRGTDHGVDRSFWVRPHHDLQGELRLMAFIHGHLLGGGYGLLTGQHGLAVDNILQVCPSLARQRRSA